MKKTAIAILLLYLLVCFVGCSAKEKSESNTPAADSSISTQEQPQSNMEENSVQTKPVSEPYTKNTRTTYWELSPTSASLALNAVRKTHSLVSSCVPPYGKKTRLFH